MTCDVANANCITCSYKAINRVTRETNSLFSSFMQMSSCLDIYKLRSFCKKTRFNITFMLFNVIYYNFEFVFFKYSKSSYASNVCYKVYDFCWFLIKASPSCIYGSTYLFSVIKFSRYFPSNLQKIIDSVIQRYAFFANPENILIALLSKNDHYFIRKLVVDSF